MKIVAGQFRGRVILAPRGATTRPTSARVREALFQHLCATHLGTDWTGLLVLDLYAGSGALGLEALSRGADRAVLVDADTQALTTARRNVEALDVADRAAVVRGSLPAALSSVRGGPFDVVFADPPYAEERLGPLLDALARDSLSKAGTLLCIEHDSRSPPPRRAEWELQDVRGRGDTRVTILRLTR